ncbi:MAG TPA: hypothetical protein ENJ95_18485 [Bacteroidetes bacterium]|nr:hypothetical protein [Bacteroidota bacterium]
MSQHKMIRLMAAIRPQEMARLAKFFRSPFHNTDPHCIVLFNALRRFHPDMEDKKLNSEYLFRRVFGDIGFDEKKMRKLRSKTVAILENYLAIVEVNKHSGKKQTLLAKALERRGAYGLFKDVAENRIKQMQHEKIEGKTYFWEISEWYKRLYVHPETIKVTLKHQYLQNHLHYLERYFTLAYLQEAIECQIHSRLVDIKYQTYYTKAVGNIAALPMFMDCPVIYLFHQIFRLYRNISPLPSLYDLKKTFINSFDKMEEMEQRMAFKSLINHAIPYSNKGSHNHSRFMFDLYRLGVEKNMLQKDNSTVSPDYFINIAMAGSLVGEFAWTRSFIKKFKSSLPINDQQKAECLVLANLYYREGALKKNIDKLKKAISILAKIPLRAEENYVIRLRSLRLRVYFELFLLKEETINEVVEQANKFKKHLSINNTYSANKKAAYLSFIQYYISLAKLAKGPEINTHSIEKYVKELSADKKPMLRQWLIEKATGLL